VNGIKGVNSARLARLVVLLAATATALMCAAVAMATTTTASLTATDCSPLPNGGFTVTLKGSGFARDDIVTLDWTDADGNYLIATVATGSSGAFSNQVTLVQGGLPVIYHASDTHGNTASLTVTASGSLATLKKEDCRDGYEALGFRNEGQCTALVESRASSR
jgi:hypothetical protein